MDRPTNPTPINPNAKYLPNTISNVLSSIQKFDQGTLAWPTSPRKTKWWTKKLCRVPLAGTASSLIPKSRNSKSKYCERVNKKNTFYTILQASQDQPSLRKSSGRKGIETDPHADQTYNDIYDIVRTYLKIKSHPPPEENQFQRDDSPKEAAPSKEIYTVRPRVAETTTHQKYSKGEGGDSKSPTAKIPIVEFYRPPRKRNKQRATFETETHKTVSKSQNQKSGIHKRRKLTVKEANKGQNIVKESSKDIAKARHGSPTVQSHRRPANKTPKRNTENHLKKGKSKKRVKLQKKSPKDVPHLDKITKADQERDLGDSKISSRFQHASAKVPHQQDISRGSYKLENKSPGYKDKSKERPKFQPESPKVEDRQDNPRVSVKLKEKSLGVKDYLKDISKFSSKAKHHHQDNFRETTKPKPIIPADQRPDRIISKPQRTIYTKVSKIKMPKSIASKSNNLTDQESYESRRMRLHLGKKLNYRFAHSVLNEIYKVPGAKNTKSIVEGRPDSTRQSKIQESVTGGNNSIMKGKPNYIEKGKIPESSTDGEKSIVEGNPTNKTEKRAPINAYELRLEMKTKPESIRKILRKQILKARNTENRRKSGPKIQHTEPISPNDLHEPPPINLSEISSVTLEPVQPRRLSQIRKSTLVIPKSRKSSVTSAAIYQEKLWKLKEYLNNMDDDNTEEISLDLEGVLESDLLYYPYNDIYASTTGDKDNKVVNRNKKKPKPPERELKPMETEKRIKKPFEKKPACMMCKAIRRPVEEAPFLVQMRKDQKRQELLAYRAHIAICNKPSQRSRARPLAIRDLDKKLYTLEDKDIVFTCPKRSNSSIFPSSSKTRACLQRCHSFTSPKESSPVLCS